MKKHFFWALAVLLVVMTSVHFASPPAPTESPPRIDATIETQLSAMENPALAVLQYAVLVAADENSPPRLSGAFVAVDDTSFTASASGGSRSLASIAAGVAHTSSC